MDNKTHQEAVKAAVKKKFKGKGHLKSRAVPAYPASAEREFRRITRGYVRLLNRALKKHLPAMMEAYKKERRGDSRFDDSFEFGKEIHDEILRIAAELENDFAEYDIENLISKAGKMVKNTSKKEWKRVVKETLGVSLMDDYYDGSYYVETLTQWTATNVSKIKSIPTETLQAMERIILDGYSNGSTIRDITSEIQKEYDTTRHKAEMLARDQVATLNAEITKKQQKDAGCERYTWSDSGDSRVRDCHRELNGKVFRWDDPPEMWYETKTQGRVYTGRKCHPGEDYCCRCVAIPVFDLQTIDIPINDKEE